MLASTATNTALALHLAAQVPGVHTAVLNLSGGHDAIAVTMTGQDRYLLINDSDASAPLTTPWGFNLGLYVGEYATAEDEIGTEPTRDLLSVDDYDTGRTPFPALVARLVATVEAWAAPRRESLADDDATDAALRLVGSLA